MISRDDDFLLARDELERALYTLPRNDPAADILRRMIQEAIELSCRACHGNRPLPRFLKARRIYQM